MSRVAIGIGANLGDRLQAVRHALDEIGAISRTHVIAVSGVYLTRPVGGPEQPDFVNAAALVQTALGPAALLAELHRIEAEAGRTRGVPNGPRTLDLDILLWGDRTIHEPGLDVPHPRLEERRFALDPLLELIDSARLTAVAEALGDQGVRRLGSVADATIETAPAEG
jgi:2-amino-4-hydroxy-6-hydroxymethyldihydropteridine diphosphokinase